MNVLEEGVLLLCCRLGDPTEKALTMAQFKELGLRVCASLLSGNHYRELTSGDLRKLGYTEEQAAHILHLLDRQAQLETYLTAGEQLGICPITRLSNDYPASFIRKQAASRPPALFALGNIDLLHKPGVAVVGSRQLQEENRKFAETAGRLAAEEGLVLISGGASGADTAAQEACLAAGGQCVVFVPDRLDRFHPRADVLYISEDGYDIPFSSARALHRNGLIHMLAEKTLAAQCSYQKGGTWQGCTENLKRGWSDLFVYDDGSHAMQALIQLGATGISKLKSLSALENMQTSLF